MKVLLIAECQKNALHPSASHLLTAATSLGPVTVLVLADSSGKASVEAARLTGVESVWRHTPPPGTVQAIEDLANTIRERIDGFSHVLAATSSTGYSLIPRLAALLDSAPITDVIEIKDSQSFIRPIHAGNALATVHASGQPLLLTLRPHAFATPSPRNPSIQSASIENLPTIRESGLSSFIRFTHSPDERPELTSAPVVVAGGRGLEGDSTGEKPAGLSLLTELADQLGAAIGASRGAVDAGLLPNNWQIGQTGKIIAPDLYIGIGISGAIQHLAGIKDAKTIVAINNDPGAPLLAVADIALTADLFMALPTLRTVLAAGPSNKTTSKQN